MARAGSTVNEGVLYDDVPNRAAQAARGKATKAGLNQLNADEFEATYLPDDDEKQLVKGFYKFIEQPEKPKLQPAIPPPPPPPFGGSGNWDDDWGDNNNDDYVKNLKKESQNVKEWIENTNQDVNKLRDNWDKHVTKFDPAEPDFENWEPPHKDPENATPEKWIDPRTGKTEIRGNWENNK